LDVVKERINELNDTDSESHSSCSIKSHGFYHKFDYSMPFNKVLKYKRRKTLTELLETKFEGFSVKKKVVNFQSRKIKALYGSRITLNMELHEEQKRKMLDMISEKFKSDIICSQSSI